MNPIPDIHWFVVRLQEVMGWDENKAILWFQIKNPLLDDCTPFAYYIKRKEKFFNWFVNLIHENHGIDLSEENFLK